MLIIFAGCPIAAPLEAVRREKFVAKVVRVDFVREIFRAVDVSLGGGGFQNSLAVNNFDVRIVQRVDVNGQPQPVL